MISIDQVLLLEEKVESAVKKIEQLNAENAALRAKCEELSNALSAKSEQFSTFQSDQSKIEEGILKALSRLNAVENVVLSAAGAASRKAEPQSQTEASVPPVINSQYSSEPDAAESPVISEQSVPVSDSALDALDETKNSDSGLSAEPEHLDLETGLQASSGAEQAEPSIAIDSLDSNDSNVEPAAFESVPLESEQAPAGESNVLSEKPQPAPVQVESPVQDTFVSNPIQENPSDSLTPDIDFEFGDSEPSTAEPKNPTETQHLFDIF